MSTSARRASQPTIFYKNLPECLSYSEKRILMLLAREGLSDREIAERLFISVKTVNHHITHILNKLGINSRVNAVIWAWQTGFTQRNNEP